MVKALRAGGAVSSQIAGGILRHHGIADVPAECPLREYSWGDARRSSQDDVGLRG